MLGPEPDSQGTARGRPRVLKLLLPGAALGGREEPWRQAPPLPACPS